MLLPNPSTTKINKDKERGSPCRIYLEGLKVLEGEPFTIIEKKVEDMRL
jgi:hypothetical protein